jgi:hypothetical protein
MERQMELLESDVVLHKKMCQMEELILQRDEEIQLLQKQVQGLLLKQNDHEMKMNSQEKELSLLASSSSRSAAAAAVNTTTSTTRSRIPRYDRSY